MANPHVKMRLEGLLKSMNAHYSSACLSASAVKGSARSEFISVFLSKANGPAFRIRECAEITDVYGNKTGEIDIILENGHAPNLPMANGETARLHFAEGVGAALEIKSSLSGQWEQAISTARKVKSISRKFSGGTFSSPGKTIIHQIPGMKVKNPAGSIDIKNLYPFTDRIPLFLVGYKGWSKLSIIEEKLEEDDLFAGVLQIDPPMYVGSKHLSNQKVEGPWSLLCFLADLHTSFAHIQSATFDILDYGRNIAR